MKRYWKTISICLVTLLVIGTFYIQSSLAKSVDIKIEFEKVHGDEKELEKLMLSGNYLVDDPYLFQPLRMTSEETINPTNLSFPQKLSRLGIPSYLEEMVKKHKNFMRSKDLNSNNFFEDESLVAYAYIKNSHERDFNFEIEVLTKKTNDIMSLWLDVPERENYGWMQVEDVQVLNGELKVITRDFHLDGTNELRVYTFDMKEQKMISDDMIASIPESKNGWSDVSLINDTYSIQQQKYLLIKSEAFENEDSDGEPNLVVNEFIIYDIENNQSKKMMAPNEILESIDGSSAIYNSTLFIPSQTVNGVDVHQYDIESDKWGKTLAFNLTDNGNNEDGPYSQIVNGKLYMIYATSSGHTIVVGDLETGESLYEGKLKVTNQGEVQKDYQLYIHEIQSIN